MTTLADFDAEALKNAVTHTEACEMVIELRAVLEDIDDQFKRLYAHAQGLELENKTLLEKLKNQ